MLTSSHSSISKKECVLVDSTKLDRRAHQFITQLPTQPLSSGPHASESQASLILHSFPPRSGLAAVVCIAKTASDCVNPRQPYTVPATEDPNQQRNAVTEVGPAMTVASESPPSQSEPSGRARITPTSRVPAVEIGPIKHKD